MAEVRRQQAAQDAAERAAAEERARAQRAAAQAAAAQAAANEEATRRARTEITDTPGPGGGLREPTALDDFGASCTSPGWPAPGSCRYGAVCYTGTGTCTIRCSSAADCPSNHACITINGAGSFCFRTERAQGLDPMPGR